MLHRFSAAIIILLVPLEGYGQTQSLRFVFTEYHPANYLDEEGNPSGFFVDIIAEAIEARLGIAVTMETYPWKRCQLMVELGEADLMATIPTPERLAYSVIVDEPIWVKRYRVYTYPGHPGIDRMNALKSVEDLKREGFTVVSYLGNSWSETVLAGSGIPVENATTVANMYRMVAAGRADILVEDCLLAEPMLRELKLDVVRTEGVIEESGFHLLLSRKSPFAGIADAVSETLSAMRADGSISAIMEGYR